MLLLKNHALGTLNRLKFVFLFSKIIPLNQKLRVGIVSTAIWSFLCSSSDEIPKMVPLMVVFILGEYRMRILIGIFKPIETT